MRTMDERVSQVAHIQIQIIEWDMEHVGSQGADRIGKLIHTRRELHTGYSIYIYPVIQLNIILFHLPISQADRKREKNKDKNPSHDNDFLEHDAKIIFFNILITWEKKFQNV